MYDVLGFGSDLVGTRGVEARLLEGKRRIGGEDTTTAGVVCILPEL